MNFFENRVESFRNNTVKWPHSTKPYNKIETFANAGFYFVRRPKASDSVRCFLCDIELSHWKPGQSPYGRHTTESPHCPWVVLNFPDVPQRKLTGNNVATQPRSAIMRTARLATFNNHNYWPPSKGRLVIRKFHAASKLADAGFYYTPKLDNPARIKCPYCKTCIFEPEKNVNILEKHRELSNSCIFFEQTHNVRSKDRRDTISSSTTAETFKTASSKLVDDSESSGAKRKSEESTSLHSSKQRKTVHKNEEAKPHPNEDSFWDIKHAFTKIATPSEMRKPAITFGKKSTARDRPRNRMLQSNAKRPLTVNIFSASAIKPQPVSLITKPKNQDTLTPVTNTQRTKKVVGPKKSVPKPKAGLEAIPFVSKTDTPPSSSSQPQKVMSSTKTMETTQTIPNSNSVSNENEISIIGSLPKKDKGKGRAIEPNFVTSSYSTKKPVSLSKSKPTKYTSALPEPSFSIKPSSIESSSSNHIPSFQSTEEPTSSRPSDAMHSPTRTYASVNKSSSPKRSSLQIEPKDFDLDLPQTPASRAIVAQKIKYLQSTPVQACQQQHSTVSAADIFGDCPFSPIVPEIHSKEDSTIFQSTPVIGGGRTRSIIDMATEEDEEMDKVEKRKRFRAISPPKSPMRTSTVDESMETPPVLTMSDIFTHVPPGQITEEEKQMKVEDYLQHVVNTNIDKLRAHGDKLIDTIQTQSDQIKSQLLQQWQQLSQ